MADGKQPKHGLNNPKIRLSAPCPTAKGKYANLGFDIWMNNPRIVVATNDPNMMNKEKQFGRITAAMEPPTFFLFLEYLNEAIRSKEATKKNLKLFGNAKGAQGGPGVEPVHLTDVWIGRDAEGQVFISVVKKAGRSSSSSSAPPTGVSCVCMPKTAAKWTRPRSPRPTPVRTTSCSSRPWAPCSSPATWNPRRSSPATRAAPAAVVEAVVFTTAALVAAVVEVAEATAAVTLAGATAEMATCLSN